MLYEDITFFGVNFEEPPENTRSILYIIKKQ